MKRGGFLKRKTPLAAKGSSDTAVIKDEIQNVVRAIVIKRDGGCIFDFNTRSSVYFDTVRALGLNPFHVPACNGYAKDGHLILQADHLITRANSATYADPRLIVCLCKGHHGWKKWHEREYNALVKQMLPADRVALWNKCEQDSWRPHRTTSMDWKLQLAALKQELRAMHSNPPTIESIIRDRYEIV